MAGLLSRVAGIAAEGALARRAERELGLVHLGLHLGLDLHLRLVVGSEVVDKVGAHVRLVVVVGGEGRVVREDVLLSTKDRNC